MLEVKEAARVREEGGVLLDMSCCYILVGCLLEMQFLQTQTQAKHVIFETTTQISYSV
jgi:hypothetical protein